MVGIREGSLWLVDSHGQPFVVPVNHPGLKARCLSAQGDSQAARMLAERGTSKEYLTKEEKFFYMLQPANKSGRMCHLMAMTMRSPCSSSL